MFDRLIAAIRVKSREEWLRMLREKWMSFRIWIQEHGELAALVGLIFGAAVILAFSLVVWVAIICLLAGFVIWSVALPEGLGAEKQSSDGQPENGSNQ